MKAFFHHAFDNTLDYDEEARKTLDVVVKDPSIKNKKRIAYQ